MTGVDEQDVQDLELLEDELGDPGGEGGDNPEGADEGLKPNPAGPPGLLEKDGPIPRADVMARSRSWIADKVMYSQKVSHTNAFGTYRQDCSGYVSMCWNLSGSLTTFSLPQVMKDIPREDLREGDVLWRRDGNDDDDTHHVALFVRWADRAKTQPVMREEFDVGHPAVEGIWKRAWASTFSPKRYKNIQEKESPRVDPLADGGLVQAQGTPVAVMVGGARIPLANSAEVAAIGAAGDPVRTVSRKVWSGLPSRPDDGTLISGNPGLPAALVVGSARLNFASTQEITQSGHGGKPVQPVPARAFRAMTSRIADGTLLAADQRPIAVVVGGARINFKNRDEIAETGHKDEPVREIPARAFDGLPGRIEDGTVVAAAGRPKAVMVGGARINFKNAAEVSATEHARKATRMLPIRVFDSLSGRIEDGTLVAAPGLPVALIVGGARVNLAEAAEITATEHAGQPVVRIPVRVFTDLPTGIADGTLVRAPGSAQVWRVEGGRRRKVAGGAAQLVPMRVLDSIPIAG